MKKGKTVIIAVLILLYGYSALWQMAVNDVYMPYKEHLYSKPHDVGWSYTVISPRWPLMNGSVSVTADVESAELSMDMLFFPDWQGNIPVIYFTVQDNFRANGTVTEYDSHNLELDEHMQPIDKDDPEQIQLYEKYKDEIRYFASRVHEVWDFWEVPEE